VLEGLFLEGSNYENPHDNQIVGNCSWSSFRSSSL